MPMHPSTPGRPARILPGILVLLAAVAAQGREAATPGDLAALVECRGDYASFMALVPLQAEPLRAVAAGWQPLPQANPFMTEYRLTAPVRVFGHDSDHIALAGDGVVAVLDLPDPRVLARTLELETALDTPAKVLFGREVRAEETAPDSEGVAWIESAVVTVSNVDSHPGKTLAGCSYSRDPLEPGADDAAPGPQPGPGASPAPAVPR